nr:type II toxin-antitoxin system RelE/ParE family toxin [uncultured Devosia sp.]
MRVRFAPEAGDYIKQESTYLRQHSPQAAATFLARMRTAARDLASFSAAGSPDEEFAVTGMRRLIRHGYRINYMIEDGELWIVGVSSSINTPLSTSSDDPDYES